MSDFIDHLIIVCCHAIWLGGPSKGLDKDEWLIEPFQEGETRTFLAHIKTGLQCLDKHPGSLLVFSGGATKRKLTSFSEGESYLRLAHQHTPLRHPTHLKAECQATDSYQNILFSILHYRRAMLRYPERITIISHAFKKRRFMELHIPAIRWPENRVTFRGEDPPGWVISPEILAQEEEAKGYGVWKQDMYGVGPLLQQKRIERGWEDDEEIKWDTIGDNLELEVRELLKWEGGDSGVEIYGGRLPWDVEFSSSEESS